MIISKSTIFVIVSSVLLAASLTMSIWDMNFLPADAKYHYIKTAAQIPNFDHISRMHDGVDASRIRWLHGKEAFILCVSILQRWLHDTQTLRPFILLLTASVCLSSILIFFIARAFWGAWAGLICYVVFATSFWPYVYVMFTKHQPLGLVFFLLALLFLQKGRVQRIGMLFYVLSGAAFCFSLYSSSVSALYFPYYAAGFFYLICIANEKGLKMKDIILSFIRSAGLCLIGFTAVFIYFNYPNIIYNVQSYFKYVSISGTFNHFYFNQPIWVQWISPEIINPRGGWLWVWKYFVLIMPILFPFYLLCVGYLFYRCLIVKQNKGSFRLKVLALILLSASSPILAEIKQVSQYGANYFTSLIGILMLLGYTIAIIQKNEGFQLNRKAGIIGILILGLHGIVNMTTFFKDIFPSRMVTSFLSQKIRALKINKIYTYADHPNRPFIVDLLDPDLSKQTPFILINNIYYPTKGYILLPQLTTDSLYNAGGAYTDFSKDIYVNELVQSDTLKDYAVGEFKTLASSRIWSQEEEGLSYRHLILNQFSPKRRERGKAWILDAEKLRKDMKGNLPRKDYFELVFKGIRNIGTKERLYIYNGIIFTNTQITNLKSHTMRMYKIGEPEDDVITYLYKRDVRDPNLWLPYGEHFFSLGVNGKDMSSDPKGSDVHFTFPGSVTLVPGQYIFVTYRTGLASDENFYRVYVQNKRYNKSYIHSTLIPKRKVSE